ncbi:MAG: hypothetical protein R2774_11605 [Saprospiraceae bacterium]
MKKQLLKPENWQDFESLCKMLWGEIWEIPYKIKKNGRIGQPQNGVDIYGTPLDKLKYWGIQCKGKDEYTHAKLTENEVDNEIEKAKNFKPELEVFIIATTSSKDSKIEEYVRLKDVENRKNKGFEIVLFCWEDIVDLIVENRSTFQFYVNNKQFKDKYDFDVLFENGQHEIILNPKYYRKIKKWKLKESNGNDSLRRLLSLHTNSALSHQMNWYSRMLENTNTAMCEFNIKQKNVGSVVIEDWFVTFRILGEHKPVNEARFMPGGMPYSGFSTMKREVITENIFKYQSGPGNPLIQQDEKEFQVEIIPNPKNYELNIEWDLKARDFQKSGKLKLIIKPIFEDEIEYVFVDKKSEINEIEIISIRENIYEIDEDKKEADL